MKGDSYENRELNNPFDTLCCTWIILDQIIR